MKFLYSNCEIVAPRCTKCFALGCREGQSRHSFRLIAGVWVLLGMVLVNSFSGILISSLTIPKMKPSIKSFEDLAASEDVEVLIRQDTGIGDAILVGQQLIVIF